VGRAVERWHDFFVAEVGASAALTGLVFVGVSLNLSRILGFAGLPNRALQALGLLMIILVLASLMLLPGQSGFALGVELIGIGGLAWAIGAWLDVGILRGKPSDAYRRQHGFNTLLFQGATLPYVVGGALLLSGNPGGLYWVAAAMLMSFVRATLDAWVLLVEINR
jgi:modulator of FtsH protease